MHRMHGTRIENNNPLQKWNFQLGALLYHINSYSTHMHSTYLSIYIPHIHMHSTYPYAFHIYTCKGQRSRIQGQSRGQVLSILPMKLYSSVVQRCNIK